MVIQADPVPLRMDEHGVIRVADSRVTLDVVIAEHKKGLTPEEIAEEFDTLELPDIYAALAYYLRHPDEVAAYLQRRFAESASMKKKIEEAGMVQPGLGDTIRKRWAEEPTTPDASPHD